MLVYGIFRHLRSTWFSVAGREEDEEKGRRCGMVMGEGVMGRRRRRDDVDDETKERRRLEASEEEDDRRTGVMDWRRRDLDADEMRAAMRGVWTDVAYVEARVGDGNRNGNGNGNVSVCGYINGVSDL